MPLDDNRYPLDGRPWVRRTCAILVALVALAGGLATRSSPATQVTNPHGRFKEECGLCHGANAWKPVKLSRKFDHSRYGFRLEGAHAAADCRSCHTSLDFSQSRTQCVSCHQDPHQGELGIDCARCHGSRSFVDHQSMMRAHQLTHFPLTGAHAGLDCESCHPPVPQGHARFAGTRAECQECHMRDYQATTNPPHAPANFPTDCAVCHTPITWTSAHFDHNRTAFPLTGAHRTVACERCHGDGVYHGKNTACVSCHQSDYNATNDPPHAASGFSTDCASCHNTTSWAGAQFDHDTRNFPIYSGRHAGLWATCATCHNTPGSYTAFTCFGCHPHSSQTQTDGNHNGISGYRYASDACYTCHPRGRT